MKHYYWVWMWHCFRMKLTFGSVGSVKGIALSHMSTHPDIVQTLRAWTEPKNVEEFVTFASLPAPLRGNIYLIFSDPWTGIYTIGSLHSQVWGLVHSWIIGLRNPVSILIAINKNLQPGKNFPKQIGKFIQIPLNLHGRRIQRQ